jgi:hypothetical protein
MRSPQGRCFILAVMTSQCGIAPTPPDDAQARARKNRATPATPSDPKDEFCQTNPIPKSDVFPPHAENRRRFRGVKIFAALALAVALAPAFAGDTYDYRKAAHNAATISTFSNRYPKIPP